MYLVIRDAKGRTLEGVVLSVAKDRMRVALRGHADTIELRCSCGQWDMQGVTFEFEALVPDQHPGTGTIYNDMFPIVLEDRA
jgi:hypothetical protein